MWFCLLYNQGKVFLLRHCIRPCSIASILSLVSRAVPDAQGTPPPGDLALDPSPSCVLVLAPDLYSSVVLSMFLSHLQPAWSFNQETSQAPWKMVSPRRYCPCPHLQGRLLDDLACVGGKSTSFGCRQHYLLFVWQESVVFLCSWNNFI